MSKRYNKSGLPFESVKIGYVDAEITAVESREIEKRDNIYGEWFAKHHEIDYDKELIGGEKVNTLIHEILHAIVHVWGIKFNSHEQEEDIVNTLGGALATLFKDNPELLLWVYNEFHGEE
jgi:Zn-dependent peptidase ImmA (M78 family)